VLFKFCEKLSELAIKDILNFTWEFSGLSVLNINSAGKEKHQTDPLSQ
jgi:hypothetical protein